MSAAEIVNKVWSYAHVLRALQHPFGFHPVFPKLRSGHDGVGYGDYVEAAHARPYASRHLHFHVQCKLLMNEVPHECV